MIFYSRKHKKNKTHILQTNNSISMLQTSTNSCQSNTNVHKNKYFNSPNKVNLRLAPTQLHFNKSSSHNMTTLMNITKPPTPTPYLRRNAPMSQIKKRTVKKMNIPGLSFDHLNVATTSWCLYDSANKKYVGFREDSKREVASLTKIMTTIVSIQLLQKINVKNLMVRITKTAQELIGTTAMLKHGNWINIYDLLYGAMLPSGNDAAYSLAQYIGYLLIYSSTLEFQQKSQRIDLTRQSTSQFVQQFLRAMNQKTRGLGLISTWFSNPHGLQNALNTSSAKDMIKLSRHAMKNQFFRRIVNTEEYFSHFYEDSHLVKHHLKKWTNTNKLLAKGWEGVKTGHTTAAGYCLSSLRDGIYIVVVNSTNDPSRFSDTQKIFNWYQDHLSTRQTKSVLSIRAPFEATYHTKTQGSIL